MKYLSVIDEPHTGGLGTLGLSGHKKIFGLSGFSLYDHRVILATYGDV